MFVGSVMAVGAMTPVSRGMCLLPPAAASRMNPFAPVALAAQAPSGGRPFEDVAAEIASPDAKVRVQAMRTLNKAGHPDAIKYIARLLTDPSDDIQLEALDTLLGFYLPEVP